MASELTLTMGGQITPDKTADSGRVQQISRPGPSAGIEYRSWFTRHQGAAFQTNYANTNTRLADFALNTWTMNRFGVDGLYTYRWFVHRFTPFAEAGIGSLVTLSGHAPPPGNAFVGADVRLEELAGLGVSYPLSRRFSILAEYQCHFFRNPDFGDHGWHPERNEVSEPKIGLTYFFGTADTLRARRDSARSRRSQ